MSARDGLARADAHCPSWAGVSKLRKGAVEISALLASQAIICARVRLCLLEAAVGNGKWLGRGRVGGGGHDGSSLRLAP